MTARLRKTRLLAPSGRPAPLPEIYAYAGREQILNRRNLAQGGEGCGYGSPLYVNAGCGVELTTAGCAANTEALTEGTLGAWWRFMHGNDGTMQVGAQYSYVRRDIFRGVGGAKGTDDNIVLLSFRYAPFQ